MGKWTRFRKILPPVELDSSFQEKVNAAKLRLLGVASAEHGNVARIAARFAECKNKKDDLENEISALNIDMEALSQFLTEALEIEEQQNVKLDNGATVYLRDTPYPSVKDKDALMAWVHKTKQESILSVHSKTLQGICGELLQAGKAVPPGVAVFLKTSAAVRWNKGDKDDAD